MSTLEVLVNVRRLLSDESRWCRGHLAQTAEGLTIHPKNRNAARWCLEGAVRKVLLFDWGLDNPIPPEYVAVSALLKYAAYEWYATQYVSVNDVYGYDAVIDLLDRLIAEQAKAEDRSLQLELTLA